MQNNFAQQTENNFVQEEPYVENNTSSATSDEVIETISKLSSLYEAGVLSDEEFHSKKLELLSRI